MGRIGKIDADDVADGGGRLIHQAAGFSEVDVFGILADLRDLRSRQSAAAEVVQDHTDEDLERRRGRQAAARQHRGGHIGVKGHGRMAQRGEPRSNAADEGLRRARLGGDGLQLRQGDLAEGIALGQHADRAALAAGDRRHGVEIHGARQHAAVLMVRVVAADLRAAGCGEYEAGLRAKLICKSLLERFVHRNDAPFCDFFLFAFNYRYLYFREICCGCNGIFKRRYGNLLPFVVFWYGRRVSWPFISRIPINPTAPLCRCR